MSLPTTPTELLAQVGEVIQDRLFVMSGEIDPVLMRFVLNVRGSFQPHLAATPGNAKLFWDTEIKPHEAVIDFLYSVHTQVRYRCQLNEMQYNLHLNLLIDCLMYDRSDAPHEAFAARLAPKDTLATLLKREPWFVVVVWITLCPWVLDTATRKKLVKV